MAAVPELVVADACGMRDLGRSDRRRPHSRLRADQGPDPGTVRLRFAQLRPQVRRGRPLPAPHLPCAGPCCGDRRRRVVHRSLGARAGRHVRDRHRMGRRGLRAGLIRRQRVVVAARPRHGGEQRPVRRYDESRGRGDHRGVRQRPRPARHILRAQQVRQRADGRPRLRPPRRDGLRLHREHPLFRQSLGGRDRGRLSGPFRHGDVDDRLPFLRPGDSHAARPSACDGHHRPVRRLGHDVAKALHRNLPNGDCRLRVGRLAARPSQLFLNQAVCRRARNAHDAPASRLHRRGRPHLLCCGDAAARRPQGPR